MTTVHIESLILKVWNIIQCLPSSDRIHLQRHYKKLVAAIRETR
jgi:hypothetical protein